MDAGKQWTTSLKNSSDSVRNSTGTGGDDSLAQFFSRPIITQVVSWVPGSVTPLSIVFNPWDEFFGNARVGNRLTNFTLLNCTLKVKFMLNGNAFYYGRAMADYVPLHTEDQVTAAATLPLENVVGASQRMHLYLDPTTSQGGEMTLPFVWPFDSLRIPTEEWVSMGQIYVRELTPLKHANASTTPVEITVSIWAEDVKMSMPTTVDIAGLISQSKETDASSPSGDEYGTGALSTVSAGLASVVGKLSSIPVIGRYARASQMGLTTMASIAKLFGYSRPPIICDTTVVRPTFIGGVATTDTGDTCTKLSVTSKQELSIDPAIFGADNGDELVLSRIAAVESFITQFPWSVSKTNGSLLFNTRVSPNMSRLVSNFYHMPACMFVARPFSYWRGTMRYRIQVVASAFHKGRLRIVYDPNYINSLESNVGFTRVVDLDVERDIVVDVKWSQPQHFIANATMANSAVSYSNTTPFSTISPTDNGVLGVYVLNTLTTPNSTVNNDITVNVFVSMLDAEFASPSSTDIETLANVYSYTPQSGESDVLSRDANAPAIEDCTTCVEGQENSDDLYSVYFGEKITSFRQLLRRYAFHSTYAFLTGSATVPTVTTVNAPDYPAYRGYSVNAIHSPTVPGKYNYFTGTLLGYLTPAFVGVRGSVRSKYHVRSFVPNAITSFTAVRGTGTSFNQTSTNLVLGTTSAYARSYVPLMASFHNGGGVTPAQHQPVLELDFPYYRNARFHYGKYISGGVGNGNPYSSIHTLRAMTEGTAAKYVDRFVSVGEDFSLFWFQGAPPMAVLATPA